MGVARKRGNSELDNIPDTFFYVPILLQIEALLQNDVVRSQVCIRLLIIIVIINYDIY